MVECPGVTGKPCRAVSGVPCLLDSRTVYLVGRALKEPRVIQKATAAMRKAVGCRIGVADGFPEDGETENRQTLEKRYRPWVELASEGLGVVCGEGGAHNKKPYPVVLARPQGVMEVLKDLNTRCAVWNFRGSFGAMDSRRLDVEYEDFHGHKLNSKMLSLLQQYGKRRGWGALDILSAHPDDFPLISDNGPFDGLPEYD